MYKQSHKRGKLLSADTFKIDIFLERDIRDQTLSQGDTEKKTFISKIKLSKNIALLHKCQCTYCPMRVPAV